MNKAKEAVPIAALVKQKSVACFKAILTLPEAERNKAGRLFLFWEQLNPLFLWRYSVLEGMELLRAFKRVCLFERVPLSFKHKYILEEWNQVRRYFDPLTRGYLLQFFNALLSSITRERMRFVAFSELEFWLRSVGGSLALCNVQLLFREELRSRPLPSFHAVESLGVAVLYWELLKRNYAALQQNKLLIPWDDLENFGCTEELLLRNFPCSELKNLTEFKLKKVREMLRISRKLLESYPESPRAFLEAICEHYLEEISVVQGSKWILGTHELPQVDPSGWQKLCKGLHKLKAGKFQV